MSTNMYEYIAAYTPSDCAYARVLSGRIIDASDPTEVRELSKFWLNACALDWSPQRKLRYAAEVYNDGGFERLMDEIRSINSAGSSEWAAWIDSEQPQKAGE